MRIIYCIAVIIVLASCKDTKGKTTPIGDGLSENNLVDGEHPGKKIIETKCYICHDATTPEANRLAPPMAAVKMRYQMGGTTKNEFINDFVEWSRKPSREKSKMPGAVQRFGVMPYLPYPEEEIKQIADYLYDNEIDQPEWFEEHYQMNHGNGQGQGMGRGQGMGNGQGMGRGQGMGNGRQMRMGMGQNTTDTDFSALGLKYALSTKQQLGKNLITAIQQKGTVGAVTFCNLKAIKLTDSMAIVHKAKIKRVSDKPRNPDNQANAKELDYINVFKQMAKNGMEISPMTEEVNDQIHFYYPITTNTMCLQCHGIPNENVASETLTTLRKLYPSDLALGYDVDEVRGIWSIVFDK